MESEKNMFILLQPRKTSYLVSAHSSGGYLYQANCLHVTHKEKVTQISIIFNRCYWCGANRNGNSILCSWLQSAHARVLSGKREHDGSIKETMSERGQSPSNLVLGSIQKYVLYYWSLPHTHKHTHWHTLPKCPFYSLILIVLIITIKS